MTELKVKDERTHKEESFTLCITDTGFRLTDHNGYNIIDANELLTNGMFWINAYDAQTTAPEGKWFKLK